LELIHLMDALRIMEQKERNNLPLTFDLKWVSYSDSKQTGGEIKTAKNVIKCGLQANMRDNEMIGIKPIGHVGHPTAVYFRLIKEFNGMEVYW